MLAAVLAAVPLGLGLLLAALPVVLVPVTMASKCPLGVARAFLAGWLLGILLVGGVVITLADVIVLPSGNTQWLSYAKIVLGLLLVVLGVKKWTERPRAGQTPAVPGWMAGIESMSGGKAFGLGLLLATLNPKNLVLTITGATAIADLTPVPAEQIAALLVFAAVGSLAVAAPVVVTLLPADRSERVLAAADSWMTRHSAVIVALVLLVLGVIVAINGFTGLRS